MICSYRVLRSFEGTEPYYFIAEAYMNDDGKLIGFARVDLSGEKVEDIREDIQLILTAFSRPVYDLNEEDSE